jgi:hypothetical protein
MNQVTDEHLSTADLAYPAAGAAPALAAGAAQAKDMSSGPLLPSDYAGELRSRWDRIQSGFVDEPKTAVQQADELVAQAIKRLAETFADARNGLERQWASGDDVSTEDLRVALRKYRTFFERLLTV